MTQDEHEADHINHRARCGQELLARLSDPTRNYPEFQRLLDGEENTYKPFYRAIALVLHPLDGVAPGASREAVEAILRATHHYFVRAIERDRDEFNSLYDFFIEVYPPGEPSPW